MILHQVMEHTLGWMHKLPPGQQQVWRAKFSAISAPEMRSAMVRPQFDVFLHGSPSGLWHPFPSDVHACRLKVLARTPFAAWHG